MQVTKVILSVLKALLFLAERDARRSAEKQVKYKKKQEAQKLVLKAEAERLYAKAHAASADASACSLAAMLGCNNINESERAASTLAIHLKHLTK